MSGDPKGYYTCLGLTPSATAAEIKSAYRRLAKEYHPDRGNVADGGIAFRFISAAYDVLDDPARRAAYDKIDDPSQPTNTGESRKEISPIRCSVCKLVAAQPRYIVYRRVISILFVTKRIAVQGVYCSTCAGSTAVKASAISAAAGWWGFPWGPIYTVIDIIKNASGGVWDRSDEERLLWHNALAFSVAGQQRLSFALADRLRSAADPEIAKNAVTLMGFLRSEGVDPKTAKLKNAWGNQQEFWLQLAMLAALPAIVAGAIFLSNPSSTSYAPMPVAASYAPVADPIPSPVLPSETPVVAPPPAVPTCSSPPASGTLLKDSGLQPEGHIVQVSNGSDGNAIVKVKSAISGRLLASVFVAQSATASIEGIPDGSYRIQYALGDALTITCDSFIDKSRTSQFPDIETFTTRETPNELGTEISRERMSYTLYGVPLGNVHPQTIDPADFDKD